MRVYTSQEVANMLGAEVGKLGSQSALAREIDITPSYLHDVLHGRRRPGAKIIAFLGLTEVRGFAKVSAVKSHGVNCK